MKTLWCRLFHEHWHCPVPYPPGSGTVVNGTIQRGGIMRMECLLCDRCWGFYDWNRYARDGYRIPGITRKKDEIRQE